MMKGRRGVFGLAAVALSIAIVSARGQSKANETHPPAHVNDSRNTLQERTGLGLIDVKQSDLLQKTIKNNWVSYNGDYTGRRFSSLAQVTPQNVNHLAAKWVFHTRNAGVLEVTPVVVAGVMFITGSNDAYALDAEDRRPVVAPCPRGYVGAG